MVLHERKKGQYDVVDGKQRLTSLLGFYLNGQKRAVPRVPLNVDKRLKENMEKILPKLEWRGAAVLHRRWPPSPCRGAAVDCVLLLGGVAGAMRGCDACRAVGGGLQSEAALIDVRLDVGSLLPRSSSPTVAGCRLGGFSFLSDVIGGVESALWEGYPASTLAHGVCVIVYV